MVGQILNLWTNVITYMVGITRTVVITFMGDTLVLFKFIAGVED